MSPRRMAEAYITRAPKGVAIEYTRPRLLQRIARWLRGLA